MKVQIITKKERKRALLAICMCLTLTACTSERSGVSEGMVQTIADTESAYEKADIKTIEIPFGYEIDEEYQPYFTFQVPEDSTFSLGTVSQTQNKMEGPIRCSEFALESENEGLNYATFSDTDYFDGTFTITVNGMGLDFEVLADSWHEYAEEALSSFAVQKNSGNDNGHIWHEIYGLHENGSYQYSALVKLDDQVAAEFSILGGSEGKIHDYEEIHDYFFKAIEFE